MTYKASLGQHDNHFPYVATFSEGTSESKSYLQMKMQVCCKLKKSMRSIDVKHQIEGLK